MTISTPVAELFREINDVHCWMMDLFQSDFQVKHWPTFYLLYVDVDRLPWELQGAADSVLHPLMPRYGPDDFDCIEAVDLMFQRVQQRFTDIVLQLGAIVLNTQIASIGDAALRLRIKAHLRQKSDWRLTFRDQYCAGRIVDEG